MAKRNPTKQSHKKAKGGVGKQSAAYHMFSTEQRAHRAELKSMSAKEQTKILGAEWRKLSAHQKQAYQAKAPAGPTHHGHGGMSKSKSHRGRSGARTKQHSHAKGASKKKTKRLDHKSTGRKAAHHAEHHHMQANETVEHSHE